MANTFNPEPIMLRNPSSLLVNTEKHQQQQEPQELPIIEIAQHLAPEQYHYEFPPKSRIMAIEAEIDENDEFSFFDECSFTTTSSYSAAAYSNIIQEEDEEDEDDEEYYRQLLNHSNRSSSDRLDRYFDSFTNEHNKFVADNQLSPLQLPSQASYHSGNSSGIMRHIREESYDSTGTMVLNQQQKTEYSRPSSFLSTSNESITPAYYAQQLDCVAEEDRIHWDEHSFVFPDQSNHFPQQSQAYRSVHPYQEDIFLEDDQSSSGSHSSRSSSTKVIVMKISKTQPPTVIHQYATNNSFISTTDEGYDDELECDDFNNTKKKFSLECTSVFLPLSDEDQEQLEDLDARRQLAAIKIQSVWRGFWSRRQVKSTPLRVMAGLARINDSIHCRNHNQLQAKCFELEQRLGEETAMRIAFEKAMEDMTILMDHQHKVLFERVQQEVDMRQAYERKMNQVIGQVQPLEVRVRHEAKARADMENMMSRVLDQLHDVKIQQKVQAEQNLSLQSQLDDALKEISLLKQKQQQPIEKTTPNSAVRSSAARPTTATATTEQKRSVSRLSSASSRTTTTSNAPIKRTTTPSTSTINRAIPPSSTTIRSSTVISRLSNRSTTDVNNSKKSTTTPTSLRKTVMNRKL